MKKTLVLLNKLVYLGLSISDLSKTVAYEFWHDYVKSKYDENVKLCYMDLDSFIIHVKLDDIYKDIAEDVETRSDTSNFDIDRLLPTGKNQKVIRQMKNELGGQFINKFVGLRAKAYSYLKDNNDEDTKAKGAKKYFMKINLKFHDYKKCLKPSQIENKINFLEKKIIDADCLKEDEK